MDIPEKVLLAIDLGGTKVAAAVVTPQGEVVGRRQEPTCQDGPKEGIRQILRLLNELSQENELRSAEVLCAGVGVPAVLEPETDFVVWAPNLKGWREVALRSELEQELGLPVFIEYDGHAAVLGEWWVGGGRGYQSLVNVIIGTGIGGGMILDGKLVRGRDRLAGAAGWLALTSEADQQEQDAQSLGFWEALAGGPGFARQALARINDHPGSLLGQLSKIEPLTAAQVFQAARQGDALAVQLTNRWADWIGLGVANIVSLVNPEIVILGGGLGSQCGFLLPRIQGVVKQWAQPVAAASAKITTSPLGGEAGLLGAAYAALLRWEERKEKNETR
jgi:glucokinase